MSSSHDPFLEHHTFQDDVWRKIHLSDFERDVIDTPEFQRLFRTSQLGFVDLVYQTANHTRGAHSIGACHVANMLLGSLEENCKHSKSLHCANIKISRAERVLIRLGALLHDVSHVPLSHDIERKKHHIDFGNGHKIKMPSFYGQYEKHDEFNTNPLLYILLFDTRRSVLARLLGNYSKPYYALLKSSAAELGDQSHLSDFLHLLEEAEKSGWSLLHAERKGQPTGSALLPTLLFHLLTVEDPEKDGPQGSIEVLRDFSSTPEPWGLGPQEFWDRLHAAWYQPFRHDIIGNTLSADLIDYLRRDPQRMGMDRRIELHILRHYILVFDNALTQEFHGEFQKKKSHLNGNKKLFRCAIDLLDDKRGTNRTVLLNDLFRLLDLRHEIHEKAVMHRVVQGAIGMLSRALLLMGDAKPTLDEILDVGGDEHPINGEDLFFHKLLQKCDATDAGREARSIVNKIIDRRVYRPLMIIPGDKVPEFKLSAGNKGATTEFRLRTLASLMDSPYYSRFLLFVCACAEKMLQGVFSDDREVCAYARRIVRDGSEHLGAAMAVIPSRVIIWTTPFKQLYKDPGIMVALKGGVIRLDKLAKDQNIDGDDRSVQNVAATSIDQADSKYASMWTLYVFVSDSLFYTGILEKLIGTNADAKDRQKTLLMNAQAFFYAALDAVSHDWSTACSRRKTTSEREAHLGEAMDRMSFASLVNSWVVNYEGYRPKTPLDLANWDPSFGISTLNIDRYVHEWDTHVGRPAVNCRDIRYKADRSSEEELEKARADRTSASGKLLTLLEACGVTSIDSLSEKEFKHLCELFTRNESLCQSLLTEGVAREVVLRSLWDGDLPGLFDEARKPAQPSAPPDKTVHPSRDDVDRDDLFTWFKREIEVFNAHVRTGLTKHLDTFVELATNDQGRDRKHLLSDVHRRLMNESHFLFNRFKPDQFIQWLRSKGARVDEATNPDDPDPRDRTKTFGELAAKTWQTVAAWDTSLRDDVLPVPLVDLLHQFNVSGIKRAPIFSTSGLKWAASPPETFHIVLDAADGGQPDEEIPIAKDALRLLSPTDRFSIAHELAHLMFLKQSGKKPGDAFFTRPGTLHSLEVECNHLARALLIPKGQLLREIGTNLFDATIIAPLMDCFRVWPGVFIWRLQLADIATAFPNSNGMLAYAEDGPSGVMIRAARVWGPKATLPYTPQDKKEKHYPIVGPQGRSIQDVRIKLNLEEFLRNTEAGKIETGVPWHAAESVACTLSAERISSNPLKAVFALDITGEIT